VTRYRVAGGVSWPVLETDWRAVLASRQWAAQMLARSRMVAGRVEVLASDGISLGDASLDSATVTMTGGGSEMWAASLSGSDPDWLPVDETDALDPRSGNRVRVWWQELVTALGGWVEVPVCTGWPHNPEADDDGAVSWSLVLRDSLTEAKRGGYGGSVVEVGGFTVDAALRALFDAVSPLLACSFPPSTVTLPATYTLGEGKPEDDWTEIAALAGWLVWTDREGTITAGPVVAALSLDWQEGEACRITGASRSVATTDIANRVIVVSTSSDVVPTITATAEDDDPASATWVGRYGPYEVTVESDAVASQEAADNLAATELAARLLPVETVTVKATPRPDLGYGDTVNLSRARIGVSGAYAVASTRLTLPGAGAPEQMEITMQGRSVA
jgi:hypothetical protein